VTSRTPPPESTPDSGGSSRTSAPASTEGVTNLAERERLSRTDGRTPEERLLARRRLGSAYLEDVRALVNRAELAEREVEILRMTLISRDRPAPPDSAFGTIRTRTLDE
jgi:hypothetical protein